MPSSGQSFWNVTCLERLTLKYSNDILLLIGFYWNTLLIYRPAWSCKYCSCRMIRSRCCPQNSAPPFSSWRNKSSVRNIEDFCHGPNTLIAQMNVGLPDSILNLFWLLATLRLLLQISLVRHKEFHI